jgi:hypothetical protein
VLHLKCRSVEVELSVGLMCFWNFLRFFSSFFSPKWSSKRRILPRVKHIEHISHSVNQSHHLIEPRKQWTRQAHQRRRLQCRSHHLSP